MRKLGVSMHAQMLCVSFASLQPLTYNILKLHVQHLKAVEHHAPVPAKSSLEQTTVVKCNLLVDFLRKIRVRFA